MQDIPDKIYGEVYSTICIEDEAYMVSIKKIYLDGFKNVKNTVLRLARLGQPITLLLAPNNYGKTNTLEAISFAANLVRLNGKDQRIAIAKNHYSSHINNTQNKGFTFGIDFTYNNRLIEYMFRISPESGVEFEQAKVDGDELFCRASIEKRFTNSNNRASDNIIIKGNIPFNVSSHSLLASIDFVGFDEIQGISDVKKYNEIIRNIFFDIHKNMLCDKESLVKEYTELLSNDIERDNIFITFYEGNKKRFNTFKRTFLELFPDIKNFRLEPQYYGPKQDKRSAKKELADAYRLEFDYKMKKTGKFHHLSSGTRGVFLLLLNVFMKQGCHLLGIEEIENGIHPSLYRDVLNTLSGLCFNEDFGEYTTKIIVTTHSPSVTRHFDKRNEDGSIETDYYASLYVGEPNNKGYATFLPLKNGAQERIRKEADSYSISIGEVVFDMLSSTDDTIRTLKGWLEHDV